MKRSNFLKSLLGIPLIGVVSKAIPVEIPVEKTTQDIIFDAKKTGILYVTKENMKWNDRQIKEAIARAKKTGVLLYDEATGNSKILKL